jgi:O-antigen ligase
VWRTSKIRRPRRASAAAGVVAEQGDVDVAQAIQAPTTPGRVAPLTIGFIVALLGTVNLWKAESLTSLIPYDLTAISVALAATVTSFALLGRGSRLERSWLPLFIGIALFTPALWVTSLENPYSLSKTPTLFTLCFLAAAAPMVLLRTEQRRVGLLRMLSALSIVMAVWLLMRGAAPTEIGSGRLQIGGENPIATGRMACLGTVIFALVVLQARGLIRLLSLTGLALCTVAAVATGSRGPLAAAVAAIVIASILAGSGQSRIRRLVVLPIVGVIAWLTVTRLAPEAGLTRLSTATGGESDAERVRLASESLRIASHHWGGVGWGDLGSYLSSSARINVQGWVQYPHNVLIETLVEGGVLALLGLLIMLWASWRRLQANSKSLSGQIMLGLWLFAFGSALTSSDLIGNRIMWMMIGVGLALPCIGPSDHPPRAAVGSGLLDVARAAGPPSVRSQSAPVSPIGPPRPAGRMPTA